MVLVKNPKWGNSFIYKERKNAEVFSIVSKKLSCDVFISGQYFISKSKLLYQSK